MPRRCVPLRSFTAARQIAKRKELEMKMKKTIIGIAVSALMLIGTVGCGGGKTVSKPLSEVTAAVKDSGVEFPEMVEVSQDNFEFKYGIASDDYDEYSVWWAGSGGDADEVCIIKAKDGKTDNVKKAVESRLDSQKEVFKDYQPAQYDKLCNSSIKTEGDYVYWLCTNDNSKAEEKLTSFFE